MQLRLRDPNGGLSSTVSVLTVTIYMYLEQPCCYMLVLECTWCLVDDRREGRGLAVVGLATLLFKLGCSCDSQQTLKICTDGMFLAIAIRTCLVGCRQRGNGAAAALATNSSSNLAAAEALRTPKEVP